MTEDALAPGATEPLVCVVEIPKGTRNKYEWDPELGGIKFDRLLMSAATYPTDYGYLRGTLGEDGDPLDALVCLYEPTFPGCLIPVKPLGMFMMRDEKGIDDKVICVPVHDPYWNGYELLEQLPLLLRHIDIRGDDPQCLRRLRSRNLVFERMPHGVQMCAGTR